MVALAESDRATVPSPAGPIVIRGKIHAKWAALKAVLSPDGDDVQAHLEHPLGEETPVPAGHGGGVQQLFRRGMIVARDDGRTFVVYGAIYDHYVAIGGTSSSIGLPTSDEEAAPHGGRVNRFENGDIYWRVDTGPREARESDRARIATGADPFARTLASRGASLLRRLAKLVGAGER